MSLTMPELGFSRDEPEADLGFNQRGRTQIYLQHPGWLKSRRGHSSCFCLSCSSGVDPRLPQALCSGNSELLCSKSVTQTASAFPQPSTSAVALPNYCFGLLLRLVVILWMGLSFPFHSADEVTQDALKLAPQTTCMQGMFPHPQPEQAFLSWPPSP